MPGVEASPTLVQRGADAFGDFFSAEPQGNHFGPYLTGLFVAERKGSFSSAVRMDEFFAS